MYGIVTDNNYALHVSLRKCKGRQMILDGGLFRLVKIGFILQFIEAFFHGFVLFVGLDMLQCRCAVLVFVVAVNVDGVAVHGLAVFLIRK